MRDESCDATSSVFVHRAMTTDQASRQHHITRGVSLPFDIEASAGLLRNCFPKGVTLANHLLGHLRAAEYELNNRPRMVLQGRCPANLFANPVSIRKSVGVSTLTGTDPRANAIATQVVRGEQPDLHLFVLTAVELRDAPASPAL